MGKPLTMENVEAQMETLFARMAILMDIVEKIDPGCVGRWEEENCAGGAPCPGKERNSP